MQATVPTRAQEPLHAIAALSLEFGRLMMESGGSAHDVEEITTQAAIALGAQTVDLRLGYASLAITISTASETVTRMRKIGPLGVNQRLYHVLRRSAAHMEPGAYTIAQAQAELDSILRNSPRMPGCVVAIAVATACAAFGRLLNVDWLGVIPIFVASFLAQFLRGQLAARQINVFLSAVLVAFVGSTLAGFGARLVGSTTVTRDMIVTVLLLVPGVPAFIAQLDILEGHPTLGSARAIWVTVILVFMTAGVWLAQALLGEGR